MDEAANDLAKAGDSKISVEKSETEKKSSVSDSTVKAKSPVTDLGSPSADKSSITENSGSKEKKAEVP